MDIKTIISKFRKEAEDYLTHIEAFEEFNELEIKASNVFYKISFDYTNDKYELTAATEIKNGQYRDYAIDPNDKLQIIADTRTLLHRMYTDIQREKESDEDDSWKGDFRELYGNPLYM